MSGQKTIGSNDATVMEKFGTQAAPTQIEQKAQFGEAAPTVLERQIAPPKKSNTAMISAIAAAVVLILGIGAFVMTRSKSAPQTALPAASSASVVATAPPITDGRGVLLLSASPWGDLEKIVNDQGKKVDISDDKSSTPTRIELPPGKYSVTLAGPNGKETFVVQIEAGKPTKMQRDLGMPNLDELQREMQKQ
jgi:hypothetical protein